MVDRWHAFDDFREIVSQAEDGDQAWTGVLDHARELAEHPVWQDLAGLDPAQAAASVKQRLNEIWSKYPVPSSIHVLFFGLSDMLDPTTGEGFVGYYVSGCPTYDPDDEDSIHDQRYFPDDRFIRTDFLDAIKRVALMHPTMAAFIDYAVLFAGAAILTKFGLPSRPNGARTFVGFDEGDWAEII